MNEPKYITINGVMKKNPKYSPEIYPAVAHPSVAIANAPLAVVSSLDDVMEAAETQEKNSHITVPVAESTAATVELLQDAELLQQYKARQPLDGGELLDKIGEQFMRYEVPLGMVNKLMMLTQYKLDFIIDDSGSMSCDTDVDALEASEPVKSIIRPTQKKMTRIQEAEDRLHIMIGILAYLPIEHIQVRFLNDKNILILDRSGKTPDEYKIYAHNEIRQRFSRLNLGGTPVAAALKAGFDAPGQWSHYLFNDGEPNEGGRAIAQQIIARKNPEAHALTLISCTNNDTDTQWMKAVDSTATYVAEVDDFSDEKDEVVKNQGPALPYTRGLWILCQLVAAINPFDLDALDENLPLTKHTLDNILGRKLNPNEYQYYFERNPNAALYVTEYRRFLNDECFAHEIISIEEKQSRETRAGYIGGERPRIMPTMNTTQLTATTALAQQQFAKDYPAAPSIEAVTAPMSAMSIAPNATLFACAAPKNSIEQAIFNYTQKNS